MKQKTKKCLNPNCSSASHTRGLCSSCYQTAIRLIATKQTSWERLIEIGRATDTRGQKNLRQAAKWMLSK